MARILKLETTSDDGQYVVSTVGFDDGFYETMVFPTEAFGHDLYSARPRVLGGRQGST